MAYGPHATQTSGGYYHLGKVFLHESKPDIAISLHDQVSGEWTGEGEGGRGGEGGGGKEKERGGEEGGGSQILILILSKLLIGYIVAKVCASPRNSTWFTRQCCTFCILIGQKLAYTIYCTCVGNNCISMLCPLSLSHKGGDHLAHTPLWAGPELTSYLH